MLYPQLQESMQSQTMIGSFYGYNHNLKIGAGEWYEMENLSSDAYPLMTQRKKRGVVRQFTNPQALVSRDALAWIEGGTLFYNGLSMQPYMPSVSITEGEKQIVAMGAYLCIFPDGIFFNTQDFTDNGYMGRKNTVNAAQTNVKYSLCKKDGSGVTLTFTQAETPEALENGQYWMDTSADTHVLKQWSASSAMWVQVPTVYTKVEANGIGTGISQWDGIQLTGCAGNEQVKALEGSHVVYEAQENWIVIVGIIDDNYTQNAGTVTVERKVPDMDYVTESQNRLWGCKYGVVGDRTVNEIYCCKLGDFKNWECYLGISTDSFAASVGSDGPWTGAATLGSSPIFFKEDCLHRVYPSSTGAHQVVETKCRGVEKGSYKSLAVVTERLYYKSRTGICVYDGSLPVSIAEAFGTVKYKNAVGAAVGEKYFVSMQDEKGKYHLFVYDTQKGMWHREDETQVRFFAAQDDELFFVDGNNTLTAQYGTEGTPEEIVTWSAETGMIGYETEEKKYLSRFNLRMKLPRGAKLDLYMEYDSSGLWKHCGHIEGRGTRTFLLPVRPARCDHLRFRIEGKGEIKLYSLAVIREEGSDA